MFGFERNEYDRRVYEEQLRDFLPDSFVDVHTHVYKKEFCREERRAGLVEWTKLVAEECTTEDLLQTYCDMFPGKSVTPVLFGQPSAILEETNAYIRDEARAYGFPALYCTHGEMDPESLMRDMLAGGFCGLKPYLNNVPVHIPTEEVRIFDFLPHEHLRLADKHGWVVMLHIPRAKRLCDPMNIAQLMEIEQKYPNVRLIVAHIGRAYAPEDIGNAFGTLGKSERMLFDFAANTLDTAMSACLDAVGPKRLMFGSDLPITKMRMYRIAENGVYYNVVPRGLYGDISCDAHMRETDEPDVTCFMYEELLAFKRAAQKAGLTRAETELVLGGNARRVFGMA